MNETRVGIYRTATEAKADYQNTWAQGRTFAQLGGMELLLSETGAQVWVDFFSSRGTCLNAGAKIPASWMDELARRWLEKRGLLPKQEV